MPENADRLAQSQHTDPGCSIAYHGSPCRRILQSLFEKLEVDKVRYCHWKSNFRLEDALSGADDVDLLVDREHAAMFQSAILELGFKLAVSKGGKGHPGVFHAIGLDEERLELVHVHAYFQIVSGDSLVKSYRFAVEDRLLDKTRLLHNVRTPTPEAELVLLTLRLALKHVHAVEIMMARRDAKRTTDEIHWLLQSCELSAAASLCNEWFPEIGTELFLRLVAVFSANQASVWTLSATGREVATRLKERRRISGLTAALSRAYRVTTQILARLHRRRDLVLQTSGMIVAIVGPKATGKSTLSAELAGRLSTCLNVEHIHAGKPAPTPLTALPRLVLPFARQLFPNERPGEYDRQERQKEKRFSWIYCLRVLMLAHDRRVLLRRAFRKSTAGAIVVSDRYPSTKPGVTDSSCFDDLALERAGSGWKRWMMIRERAAYQRMPCPGLVIRLTAPIELTILRDETRSKEGGPDADVISRRWEKEISVDFRNAISVSTDRSLDETVAEVIKTVWKAL